MSHPLVKTSALVLCIGLAACGGDKVASTTNSSDVMLDHDMAVVAADGASEDVEMVGGPQGSLGFGLAPSLGPINGLWGCGTKTRDGLTLDRTCTFKDADGVIQAVYNTLSTAEVDLDVTVTGSVTRPNWTADVNRVRHLVVTGLTGHETSRTWNGTGNGTVNRSRHTDNGEPRTYDITYVATFANIVVPVPHTENSWPTSGTITRISTISITGGPRDGQTVTRTVVVTFNGTENATIEINGKTFTFDLKTRTVVQNS